MHDDMWKISPIFLPFREAIRNGTKRVRLEGGPGRWAYLARQTTSTMSIHQFLADLQAAVEPREIAAQASSWDAEMNASPENQARLAAADSRLQECYSDRSR